MEKPRKKRLRLLNPLFFRGIGRKILLWLAFFSLVPLVVSSIRSYQHNRDAITRDVLAHLSSVVSLKKAAILKLIEYNRSTVEGIVAGNQHLYDLVHRLEFFPEGSEEYLEAFRSLTGYLIRKKQDNRSIRELFVLDPRGRVICSSDPAQDGKEHSERRYFTMARHGTYVSPIFFSDAIQEPSMITTTPIIDNEEQWLGVLALRMNLSGLYAIINDRTGMRTTGQTYIVDERGLLLSETSRDSRVALREHRTSPAIEKCLQGRNGQGIYVNYQGKEVVGAYRWLPDMRWGLIAEIETEEAFMPIYLMRDRTVFLAVFILIAALLAAFIITHDIVEPVSKLVAAVRRMSKGVFAGPIVVRSNDEFEELAREFNHMARSLQEYKEKLEDWNLKLSEEVRKRTQELKRSEEKYLNLIESSADAIIVTDMRGKVTFFSRGAEAICGYRAQEVMGRPIYEFYEGGKEEAKKLMKILAVQGRTLNYELLFKAKDRGTITMSISASLLKDREGNYEGVLGIGKDVTEVKALEKQLVQAERLATIGRMSSQVAHEIRNPLSSISLNAELLEEELREKSSELGEEMSSILKAIHSEVKRLYDITEDYLQFARLPKVELDVGDVNRILADLLDFYQEELCSKDIRLKKRFSEERLVALVDENQLRRAVLNVLRNALEASEPGGEILTETAFRNGNIEIVIADEGKGIPKSELERIFEPFYSTKERGTGLGLPLTQQIVREHRGTIRCESSLGKGTRFVISLPRYQGKRT